MTTTKTKDPPEQVSADVFLSRHGIDYSRPVGDGLHGTPAEIVAHLKALNATRTVVDGELVDNVYRTPGFVAGPDTASAHDMEKVDEVTRLEVAAVEAEKTGNFAKIHKATDAVNAQRMSMGGMKEYIPSSDFEIIAKTNTPLGEAARLIKQDRVRYGTSELMHGSPIPWFDLVEAFEALSAF